MIVLYTLVLALGGSSPSGIAVVPNHPDKPSCEAAAEAIRLLRSGWADAPFVCVPTAAPRGAFTGSAWPSAPAPR